jgi:HSP20 family protein
MSMVLRREPRSLIPDLIDWFESPFTTLRPYLAQAIRVEDYLEEDKYVLRAELAGLDPDKDIEVSIGAGYLTIRAERYDKAEGKQRSEFRYGTFTRTVSLPPAADEEQVTASYDAGILTVTVPLKDREKPETKRIPVAH